MPPSVPPNPSYVTERIVEYAIEYPVEDALKAWVEDTSVYLRLDPDDPILPEAPPADQG